MRNPTTVVLASLAGIPLGLVVGTAGSFLQASTVVVAGVSLPVGLVVALALTAVLVVGAGLAGRSRLAAAAALLGWVVAVLAMATPRAEGDLVLAARALAYVWLFGGTLVGGLALALPYGRLGGEGAGRVGRDGSTRHDAGA